MYKLQKNVGVFYVIDMAHRKGGCNNFSHLAKLRYYIDIMVPIGIFHFICFSWLTYLFGNLTVYVVCAIITESSLNDLFIPK